VAKKDPIKTPAFRGSFVQLMKPRAYGDNEPKYAITVVLPKENPFWKLLRKAVEEVAIDKFEKVPKGFKSPIRDGDDTEYEDWKGCYFAKLQSDVRVPVVEVRDGTIEPVDADEFADKVYSGAWFKATFRPYSWHYPGPPATKGVSLQLDNVLSVQPPKGETAEPFSGRSSAADDFAGEVDGAGEVGNEDEDSLVD